MRHPHRGSGADRLPSAERRAGAPAAAVRHADRQDRAVLHRRWPSSASIRLPAYDAAEPRAAARRSRSRLSADPHHRRPREELPPLPLPRSALGASRCRPIRASPCTPTRRAPWASRTARGCNLEVARGKGTCRLRIKLSDATPPDVVNTGMGWWLPASPAPEHGALDVNINAALDYDGPWDPVSGSSDVRGHACRVVPIGS